MISVIIPAGPNEKINNISRTIGSLRLNASGAIEIVLICDGWTPTEDLDTDILYSFPSNLGERATLNKGVDLCNGEYILRLDAHCSMSRNWDKELVKFCEDKTICVSRLDAISEETWESRRHDYRFVYLNKSFEEKWWGGYREQKELEAEPTLTFTGCGWLCKKTFYQEHLRADETLTLWGSIGPEMSLRAFLAKGKVILCKNVICGHVFTTNPNGYPVQPIIDTKLKLLNKYANDVYDMVQCFSNVPSWHGITKDDYLENYERYVMDSYKEVNLERVTEKTVTNGEGEVIKKVKIYHEPMKYSGNEDTSDQAVTNKLTANQPIKYLKVLEKVSGNWETTNIEDKDAVALYLFDNDLL